MMEVNELLHSLRNIDNLRLSWESSKEWNARKHFIVHNWNDYPDKDILVSLSSAWANVHFLGNRYPEKVMAKLESMEKGLNCADIKRKQDPIQKIEFVKSSTHTKETCSNSSKASLSRASLQSANIDGAIKKVKFVKSEDSSNEFCDKLHNSTKLEQQSTANSTQQICDNLTQEIKKALKLPFSNSQIAKKSCLSLTQSDTSVLPISNRTTSHKLEHFASLLRQKQRFLTTPASIAKFFADTAAALSLKLQNVVALANKKNILLFEQWSRQFGVHHPVKVNTWVCDIYLGSIFISQGYGQKSGMAKNMAFEGAMMLLLRSFSIRTTSRLTEDRKCVWQDALSLEETSVECPPAISILNVPCIKMSTLTSHTSVLKAHQAVKNDKFSGQGFSRALNSKLKDFVLVSSEVPNPISDLISSTSLNQIACEFVMTTTCNPIKSEVFLDGFFYACASGPSGKDAKANAAKAAIDKLKQHSICLVRKRIGDKDQGVKRNALLNNAIGDDSAISEDNIGNKLLRKMGWSGTGGIGKNKDGISTPVTVDRHKGMHDRTGIGHDTGVQGLVDHKHAQSAILNYISNGCVNELTFSAELTKDERKKIHNMARKYGLKSRSYGVGDDRHLVLYKNLSIKQIAQTLLREGGELNGYALASTHENQTTSV